MENKPDRNYWLHRITGGANALPVALRLLSKNEEDAGKQSRDFYISIGWSDFSSDKFVQDVLYGDISVIEEQYKKYKYPKSRNRWCLWRFIHEMKKGDYVVVPSWGVFGVYEIVDNDVISNQSASYLFKGWGSETPSFDGKYIRNKQKNVIDLGFYRRVVPIATNISRSDYADPKLVARMKNRKTNIDIHDLEYEILQALKAYAAKKPINLKANILKSTTTSTFRQIKKTLTPDKLEKLVEWYMKSLGAEWVKTPAKNGSPTEKGDADKEAVFEKLKLIIMVQVKKHDGTTNEWAVQQITAYKENSTRSDEYTSMMWVISTCDRYNKAAQKFAHENGVRLINGREFAGMILEAGLNGMEI